jgi:hypothetical protein
MIDDFDPFTDADLDMVVAAPRKPRLKAKRFPAYRVSDDPGFGKAVAVPCPTCRALTLRVVMQGLAWDYEPRAIPLTDEAGLGVPTFSLKRFGSLIFVTHRAPVQVGVDNRYPVLRLHVCERAAA